jgi:hypothetical protein
MARFLGMNPTTHRFSLHEDSEWDLRCYRDNPRFAVVSSVPDSELKVCRSPISTEVGAYSCRTTLRREGSTWSPPL